ncbi:MAG: carboxymuconolactone decarboxylase family protein [Candidatus Corynebacterium faecigallinarum]
MNTSRSQSSDGPTTRVQRPGQKRPGIRELGVINKLIVTVGAKVQGTHTLGVFATIGRAKRLFKAWLVYSATMMPFGYLSRQETELVILRVAFRKGSAYEEAHHRVIGASEGLSQVEIDAMFEEDHGQLGRRGVMLDVADQIVATEAVDDETWAKLSGLLSDKECVALVMLVTNYSGLATALSVLGTPVDKRR